MSSTAQLMSVSISVQCAQNCIYVLCITLCNVVKFKNLFRLFRFHDTNKNIETENQMQDKYEDSHMRFLRDQSTST